MIAHNLAATRSFSGSTTLTTSRSVFGGTRSSRTATTSTLWRLSAGTSLLLYCGLLTSLTTTLRNDYGESHYIGDIGKDQPNSQAWVNGFDHTPILGLTSYYAQAFKNGAYPAITKDFVFMAARTHAHDAIATNDPVGQPTSWETTVDMLWTEVHLTEAATVTLATSDGNSKSFQVGAGVQRMFMPLTVGGYIQTTIERNGASVLTCKGDGYAFTDSPETYNFNSFMAAC